MYRELKKVSPHSKLISRKDQTFVDEVQTLKSARTRNTLLFIFLHLAYTHYTNGPLAEWLGG